MPSNCSSNSRCTPARSYYGGAYPYYSRSYGYGGYYGGSNCRTCRSTPCCCSSTKKSCAPSTASCSSKCSTPTCDQCGSGCQSQIDQLQNQANDLQGQIDGIEIPDIPDQDTTNENLHPAIVTYPNIDVVSQVPIEDDSVDLIPIDDFVNTNVDVDLTDFNPTSVQPEFVIGDSPPYSLDASAIDTQNLNPTATGQHLGEVFAPHFISVIPHIDPAEDTEPISGDVVHYSQETDSFNIVMGNYLSDEDPGADFILQTNLNLAETTATAALGNLSFDSDRQRANFTGAFFTLANISADQLIMSVGYFGQEAPGAATGPVPRVEAVQDRYFEEYISRGHDTTYAILYAYGSSVANPTSNTSAPLNCSSPTLTAVQPMASNGVGGVGDTPSDYVVGIQVDNKVVIDTTQVLKCDLTETYFVRVYLTPTPSNDNGNGNGDTPTPPPSSVSTFQGEVSAIEFAADGPGQVITGGGLLASPSDNGSSTTFTNDGTIPNFAVVSSPSEYSTPTGGGPAYGYYIPFVTAGAQQGLSILPSRRIATPAPTSNG